MAKQAPERGQVATINNGTHTPGESSGNGRRRAGNNETLDRGKEWKLKMCRGKSAASGQPSPPKARDR